jgi:hypothetical protein
MYDQLLLQASKRLAAGLREDEANAEDDDSSSLLSTYEFVVAARDGDLLPDWVPIAQIILVGDDRHRQDLADPDRVRIQVQRAVSAFRRELHHVAGLSSGTFRSVPRQRLQYAAEPVDSFFRHVYDRVVEPPSPSGSSAATGNPVMSSAEARTVLQIAEGGTLRDLKLQYRRRSLECHPDSVRHQQQEREQEDSGSSSSAESLSSAASEEFSRVKLAYETLIGSGSLRRVGSTWYESLGGRERNEFAAVPLPPLMQRDKEGPLVASSSYPGGPEVAGLQSAIMGLDPSLVQSFVARSRSSRRS